MKINSQKLILFLLLSILFTTGAFSQETQDSTTLWTITTVDGNEYIGTIIYENTQEVQIKTKTVGIVTIPVRQIVNKEKIALKNMVGDEFWFDNPQSTRYFWGPNGYGLKKGEGYYQNIWVMANQVSYGFTDNFTMGIGTVPSFLFGGGIGATPFWITPKVTIPVIPNKINIGAGALFIGIPNEGSLGLLYGTFTYGTRNNNVSFNLGYGVADGEWSNSPTISLSFMRRVSRRTYLLSENYFISAGSENLGFISFGARTVWNKISLDYGLVAPLSQDIDFFLALPWIGFSLPMGKLRRGGQ